MIIKVTDSDTAIIARLSSYSKKSVVGAELCLFDGSPESLAEVRIFTDGRIGERVDDKHNCYWRRGIFGRGFGMLCPNDIIVKYPNGRFWRIFDPFLNQYFNT